ncbi:MAG: TRAP transporter substrate-binding protein [Betaproteobacteria bacterium]
MKISGIVAALVVGVSLHAAPLRAQQEIIFAIDSDKDTLQQLTQEEFAKRANERLAGKAIVKTFHSAQLGKDKDLLQKLKLGSVHLSMPSSIMSSVLDLYGVWDMPFLIKDRAHVTRFGEKVFWPKIAPATEAKGYKVLGLWENGVRNITNNVRPINKPADLAGLKIRIPGGVWRKKMFEAWGANPTPLAFSEVFVALQTNVVDGQENPNTNIYAGKFYEVQKYLSITRHVYTPSYLIAGKETFAKLDPAVQKVLVDLGREMESWARAKGEADDAVIEDKLVAGGMKRNVADYQAFVDASKPIYEQFAKEVPGGGDLISAALALSKGN